MNAALEIDTARAAREFLEGFAAWKLEPVAGVYDFISRECRSCITSQQQYARPYKTAARHRCTGCGALEGAELPSSVAPSDDVTKAGASVPVAPSADAPASSVRLVRCVKTGRDVRAGQHYHVFIDVETPLGLYYAAWTDSTRTSCAFVPAVSFAEPDPLLVDEKQFSTEFWRDVQELASLRDYIPKARRDLSASESDRGGEAGVEGYDVGALPSGWRWSQLDCGYVYGVPDRDAPTRDAPFVEPDQGVDGPWRWVTARGNTHHLAPSMLRAMCAALDLKVIERSGTDAYHYVQYSPGREGTGWAGEPGQTVDATCFDALEHFDKVVSKRAKPSQEAPDSDPLLRAFEADGIVSPEGFEPARGDTYQVTTKPSGAAEVVQADIPSGWTYDAELDAFGYGDARVWKADGVSLGWAASRDTSSNGFAGYEPSMLRAMCRAVGVTLDHKDDPEDKGWIAADASGRVLCAHVEQAEACARIALTALHERQTDSRRPSVSSPVSSTLLVPSQVAADTKTENGIGSAVETEAGAEAFSFARAHDACVRALDWFGPGHNSRKLEEEMHELGVAMAHYPDGKSTTAEVITELCDVALCCYMQALSMGIDDARAELMRKAARMNARVGVGEKPAGSFEDRMVRRCKALEARLAKIEATAKGGAA